MNPNEIIELVAEMRAAQRDYFSTRSHDSLRKSKALEKRVDQEIKLRQLKQSGNQAPEVFSPSLFENE